MFFFLNKQTICYRKMHRICMEWNWTQNDGLEMKNNDCV